MDYMAEVVEFVKERQPGVAAVIVIVEPEEGSPNGRFDVVTRLPREFLNNKLAEFLTNEHNEGF